MTQFTKAKDLQVRRIAGKCIVFWYPQDNTEIWATARVANQVLAYQQGQHDEPILFTMERETRFGGQKHTWLAIPSIFG